jgi:uncharacterized peroxidase-related enzyme
VARTKPISPKNAEGELKTIYSGIERKMGNVPNIFQYMANSLPLLKGYLSLNELANGTSLSPKLREQIQLSVSQNNNCLYCLSAHTAIAKNLGLKENEILQSRKGESADPKTKAILQFCKKLVDKKGFVDDQDVTKLKSVGVNDQELGDILLVCIIGIYTNYFNHLNDTPNDFPEAVRLEEVTAAK